MGADIVIGSNVSNALLAGDKINNVLQVLLQIAFFREAEDTKQEVPLVNIYAPTQLEKYTMGSFSQAEEIIEAGLAEGRALYPQLKKLADSLDAIYGPVQKKRASLPDPGSVELSSYEVRGNKHTTSDFIVQSTDIITHHYYSPQNLSHMIRRTAGTRYYSRINYSLQPRPDSTAKIIFDVTENPLTFAKIGLNYNQFAGISAILNLTTRDFFTPNSRSLVTLNIGQNFRVRAEHLQYFGRDRNIAVTISPLFEQFNITTYRNHNEAGLYSQQYFRGDGRFGVSTNRDFTFGVGTRFETVYYNPSFSSAVDFNGSNNFLASYVFIKQNTLDRPVYPKRGFRLDMEVGYVYSQRPHVHLKQSNSLQDTIVSSQPYTRVWLNMETYAPLSSHSTFLLLLQSGMNFNYDHSILNEFSIGGLNNSFHNQVLFAGLRENSFYSNSLAALQIGLRYQLNGNVYITGRANAMLNNFVNTSRLLSSPDFLSGYSLTFSYNFALGPLEISAMYSDQWKKVLGYINIGIPF